ncbi:MAG: NAD-binding protein [Planctomycetota bacterium]|jgi:voltage-gated potassium channel
MRKPVFISEIAMPSNRRLFVALLCCAVIIAVGAVGYMTIEGYSLTEAVYMSVITITTVGFGEVRTLSEPGRLFTTVLILVGFASLAFTGHAVVESLLEQKKTEVKRMKKRITHLVSHYIVCGYGQVGAAAAELFRKEGAPFVVIEAKPENCQKMRERGFMFIEGDATHEEVLQEAGVKRAKGLIALLNSDPDNLFIVLTARESNLALHIIARAHDPSSERRILRAGADRVISPYKSAGRQIAADVLSATGKTLRTRVDSAERALVPQWVMVNEGSGMIDETMRQVANHMGRDILGFRRKGQDVIFPDPDTRIECGDLLFIMDEEQAADEPPMTESAPQEKVVIVDDNPVILRLFSRLFQKAGYRTLTASNGEAGLDLIVEEQPVAAIIDYMLPMLSGIELCSEVQKQGVCPDTKLILFTTDDQPDARQCALEAGADSVIVKDRLAADAVESIIKILQKDREEKAKLQEKVEI